MKMISENQAKVFGYRDDRVAKSAMQLRSKDLESDDLLTHGRSATIRAVCQVIATWNAIMEGHTVMHMIGAASVVEMAAK